MLKSLFAAISVLAVVAGANAAITMDHELWSAGFLSDGVTAYETWRFNVHVSDHDDWTAAGIHTPSPLVGGVFFQAGPPYGGDVAPDPAHFDIEPNLQYDTFYGDPSAWPNTNQPGSASMDTGPPDTPTTLRLNWFDTVNTGDGDFVILQVTILPVSAYSVTFHLDYAAANSGGTLFSYDVTLTPEPAALTLFVFAGLALTRRR